MEDFGENSDCESVALDDEPVLYGCGSDSDDELEVEYPDDQWDAYVPPSVDSAPEFRPLRTHLSPHEAQHQVPEINRNSPLAFFKLIVTDEHFALFAKNTNQYARSKDAFMGNQEGKGKRRLLPWKPKSPRIWFDMTAEEVMVWFALLIFMGLVKTGGGISRVESYWKTDGQYSFEPMKHMGLVRFQQIKRYFHLSAPVVDNEPWYYKIEPFGKAIRDAAKYILPPTQLSIDEMMVRFTGRSAHTVKMKNKPISQGYKLLLYAGVALPIPSFYYSLSKKNRTSPENTESISHFIRSHSPS